MGINKEAGKRSEVPFSRREEGRELGEEKERKRKKKRKVMKDKKKTVLNVYRGAFKEDFGDMEVLIEEEEVCDFSGGDAA